MSEGLRFCIHGIQEGKHCPDCLEALETECAAAVGHAAGLKVERDFLRASLAAAEAEVKVLRDTIQQMDGDDGSYGRRTEAEAWAFRRGTDAMLKEALGEETFSRLWGPPLEALGRFMDRLRGERDEAVGALKACVDHLSEWESGGGSPRGNAPGHAHEQTGIWDDDNGAKAGTTCEWCATWPKILAVSGRTP